MAATRIVPFKRQAEEWTSGKIVERANQYRDIYEDRLKKGDYYFVGSLGRMTGTAEGALMVFGKLLPALENSKDTKAFYQQMQHSGFPYFDEEVCEAFFVHRVNVEKLKIRVQKMEYNNQ